MIAHNPEQSRIILAQLTKFLANFMNIREVIEIKAKMLPARIQDSLSFYSAACCKSLHTCRDFSVIIKWSVLAFLRELNIYGVQTDGPLEEQIWLLFAADSSDMRKFGDEGNWIDAYLRVFKDLSSYGFHHVTDFLQGHRVKGNGYEIVVKTLAHIFHVEEETLTLAKDLKRLVADKSRLNPNEYEARRYILKAVKSLFEKPKNANSLECDESTTELHIPFSDIQLNNDFKDSDGHFSRDICDSSMWDTLADSIANSLKTGFGKEQFECFKLSTAGKELLVDGPTTILNQYVESNGQLYVLLKEIKYVLHTEQRKRFYSPYIAIIQSSGYGKSKLMFEVCDHHITIFVCLRSIRESSGVPLRSYGSSYFEGLTNSGECIALFCGMLIAIKVKQPDLPFCNDISAGRNFARQLVSTRIESQSFQLEYWKIAVECAEYLLGTGAIRYVISQNIV